MLKTILPIISGGLDSCVMLFHLRESNYSIPEAITFNYGQRHNKEIEYAQRIVEVFIKRYEKIRLQVVNISNIGSLIAKGALTGEEDLPEEMYDNDNQRVTIVPNRNMILLSIAAGRAITIDAENIGYAAHASDYSVYPDCRPEFIEVMDQALIQANLWNPIRLVAPFQNMTKADIVRIGLEMKAPLEITWSCYASTKRPCGVCGTCLERTESFLSNDAKDPAMSNREWKSAVDSYHKMKASSVSG